MACPNCYSEILIISFDWPEAQSSPKNPYHDYLKDFKFLLSHPWGDEYVSTCCNSNWLLLPNKRMNLLSPKQKEYFIKAQQHKHHVNSDLKNILKDIGGTSTSSKMGNQSFPCSVTLKTGQLIECATLILGGINQQFFHSFPYKAYIDSCPYYFLDEAQVLEPSPYAFSHALRRDSRCRPEIAMGSPAFYKIQNNQGASFTLNVPLEFCKVKQNKKESAFCMVDKSVPWNTVRPISGNDVQRNCEAIIICHDPKFYHDVGSSFVDYRRDDYLNYKFQSDALIATFKDSK